MCFHGFREHYEIVSTKSQTSDGNGDEIDKKIFPKWFKKT